MNRIHRKPFWQRQQWSIALIVGLLLVVAWAASEPFVQDFWKGLGYEPTPEVAAAQADLALTSTGERIFKATNPVLEGRDDFNTHCNSHDVDVSLLGCYVDGRIYVYEITEEQLKAANKVTLAHELLHAAWERMKPNEREEIGLELEKLYMKERAWFDKELEAYDTSVWVEEMYTRAGTKLEDLPEVLEEHYAQYFRERARLVKYYQEYEAPFLVLQMELETLADKIETVRAEIEAERLAYIEDVEALDVRIERFNSCAELAGCFTDEVEFNRQRAVLVSERNALESRREKLNAKIDENNQRIEDYRERQEALGELNDAMNSNIEPIIEESKI